MAGGAIAPLPRSTRGRPRTVASPHWQTSPITSSPDGSHGTMREGTTYVADDERARKRRAVVVYHPTKVNLKRLERLLDREETRAGWAASAWVATELDAGTDELNRRILAEQADVVIAAGGDGTVRAVAEAVRHHRVPLGILPVGSTNLLARNLGLALIGSAAAVRAALTGEERLIDVGTVTATLVDGRHLTRAFLVMAGFGVDAQMVVHTSPASKEALGWLAYVNGVTRGITRKDRFDVVYRLDGGRSRSARLHTLVIGNGGRLPAGLRLLPNAVIDDGELDLVLIRPDGMRGWGELAAWWVWENNLLQRILRHNGRRRPMPAVGSVQQARAREVRIAIAGGEDFQIDGEYLGKVTALRVTVEHRALRVRVPTGRSAPSAEPPRS